MPQVFREAVSLQLGHIRAGTAVFIAITVSASIIPVRKTIVLKGE